MDISLLTLGVWSSGMMWQEQKIILRFDNAPASRENENSAKAPSKSVRMLIIDGILCDSGKLSNQLVVSDFKTGNFKRSTIYLREQ